MPPRSAWAIRSETPLQEKEINARYVFDMIYDPPETRFLKLAKERGAQVIPGIEMFVHQAARQFEIWTGKPAPWDEMLRVVLLALQERDQPLRSRQIRALRCLSQRNSCFLLGAQSNMQLGNATVNASGFCLALYRPFP